MTETDFAHRIAQQLLDLGVRPNGILLVHSSLSSLGHVPGGAETVVRGLLQALGENGTLLMPALSYERVTPVQASFDMHATPSNVGAIPEHFRTRPGTLRSVHPTHSVCGVGPLAADLLRDHHKDRTPCGSRSPFHRLPDCCGQILMLGCGLRPNTSMHAIEELIEPPYLFGKPAVFYLCHGDGTRTEMRCRCHGFSGFQQRYDRVAEVLTAPDLQIGPVLEATVHLIEARSLWKKAAAKLREEPLYFVDRI